MSNGDTEDSGPIGATKLSNNMWAWIYTHDNGAWLQSAEHYKTKAAAIKAGKKFEDELGV